MAARYWLNEETSTAPPLSIAIESTLLKKMLSPAAPLNWFRMAIRSWWMPAALLITFALALEARRSLRVVTNGLEVARLLANNPTNTVILIGGILSQDGSSVTGLLSEQAIRDLHVQKAFVSCSGFSVERGMTEVHLEEAQLKRKALESAQQVFALVELEQAWARRPDPLCPPGTDMLSVYGCRHQPGMASAPRAGRDCLEDLRTGCTRRQFMKAQNYLALDLGAESGRAIVGTLAAGKLSLTETHRFANLPVRLRTGLHWDTAHLWKEIKNGLAISGRSFSLASLALDAWGVDFALLDGNHQLLGDPFHYRDARTDGILAAAFQRVPREQIFSQTGIQFMQINTLYQLLSMVIARAPELEAAQTFLTIPDLFNYWLSGSLACEFTNATTTQCFDPRSRSWAFPLLHALGIPPHIFPPVCEPGTVLGSLLPEISAETGAGSIPVIAPACHDTGSAVAAVPAANADFAWLSSGTWSILGAEVGQPNLSPQALAYNFTNEGGVFGSWRLSKNIMGLWIVQECKREWGLSYAEITGLAAEAQPFLAVIDPDSDIFLHPGKMPEKICRSCAESGQAVPRTQGEIARVALESLALKYRLTLERLEELSGKRLDPIHIIGGGTKNRLLNQFTADCTGRRVIAGPVEATATGNLLIQAIALGHLGSLADARAVVRQSFPLETYHPASQDGWDEAYAKLLSIINPNPPMGDPPTGGI